MNTEKAKEFIYKNARPVELALYQYFYEGRPKSAVIKELSCFQNEDGGFGHGLEPDSFNVKSSPITTNDALIMLYRIDAFQEARGMIDRMVQYLTSHDSFNEEKERWLFAIDSNKEYPHAVWWEKNDSDGIEDFNPSISLAAFLICYGKKEELYKRILQDGLQFLSEDTKLLGDGLKCYLLAYSLLRKNGITDVVNLDSFKNQLALRLQKCICRDIEKYGVEYVATPADFFSGTYLEFVTPEIQELIDAEMEVLGKLQKEDGGFDISWQWYTPYSEFEQARKMWRGRLTVERMLYAAPPKRDLFK